MHPDRLDKTVIIVLLSLTILIGITLLRGDQVGIQVTQTTPAANTRGVTTRTQLAITFSEPIQPADLESSLRITPALSVTLHWNGNSAYLTPQHALQSDTTYTITLPAGVRSERGRALLHDVSWSFHTGHPRIIYLSPASGIGNLYISEADSDQPPKAITTELFGVYDYAVSPDGRQIVYASGGDKVGQNNLWVVNPDGTGRQLLLPCTNLMCQSPAWSADGTRIAFEQRTLVSGGYPGPGRIWILDLTTQTVTPLLQDNQQLGTLPRWAPQGDKLAYYNPVKNLVTVLDTTNGQRMELTSDLGDSGVWSPDAQQLIYPQIFTIGTESDAHLLRVDLASTIITPVLPLTSSNNATTVAWSPTGEWLAFGLQDSGVQQKGSPSGPQIWVSHPDGADAHAITSEPGFSYDRFAWSPDGEWLLATRHDLQTPNAKPEVWLMRKDGSERRLLVQDATLPAWAP
jgi:Tol biopolymer transport system component